MNKDIRWKQRYQNFNKAYAQLSDAVSKFEHLDDLAKEGLVQRFEYTFELAWKTLKDYLESKGEMVKFARDVIKTAFHFELIDDGERWLRMLEKRNLMAHTYDEDIFKEVVNQIVNEFYPELQKLQSFFTKEYAK